jgi:uncharacterized surface protein with fasciclin (FAS1) repeats
MSRSRSSRASRLVAATCALDNGIIHAIDTVLIVPEGDDAG